MFLKILPPLIVAFMFLLDTAVLPAFSVHWLMPLFALITVHTLGLLLGRTSGVLYGMICGLLVDITVSTPLGLMTGFYSMLGYAGGWLGKWLFRKPLGPAISGFICFAVFEVGMALYTTIAGAAFAQELFKRALIRLALDGVLVQIFYIVYDRILQPDHSAIQRE